MLYIFAKKKTTPKSWFKLYWHFIHDSKGSDDLSYIFKLCDVANENCLFTYFAFGKYYLFIEGRESGDKQDFERMQKKKKGTKLQYTGCDCTVSMVIKADICNGVQLHLNLSRGNWERLSTFPCLVPYNNTYREMQR